MSLLIQYLVKLSISLAIVWLFYQFVLRRLTFYNSNRWYLVGYTLLSFLIPLINIAPLVNNAGVDRIDIVQLIPSVHQYTIALEEASQCPVPIWSSGYDKWDWTAFALMTGTVLFLIRFIIRCYSFFRMRRKARLISSDGVLLYHVNDRIIPFSFGNAVFINSELHSETELREIMSHEFVHVKQMHTLDIIWSELLCIINWYNPFAWLLKRSMRQNLEFIADSKVLENGINKKQYQYLLLKVIGNNQFSIAQKFNFSSLKKRIAMMNKLKTAKLHLVKFIFVLPLLAVILISFRKQLADTTQQQPDEVTTLKTDRTDTVPDVTTLNHKGYYIDIKNNKGECMVVVRDKNRKEITRLPLVKWDADKSYYVNLYGAIPPPPPPVPAVPPLPPDAKKLPANVKNISVVDRNAIVELKNGKQETYNLDVSSEKNDFESKYGRWALPPAPPNPPAAPVKDDEDGIPPVVSAGVIVNGAEVTNLTGVIAPVVSSANTIITGHAPITPAIAVSLAPVSGVIANNNGYQITGMEDIVITITNKTTPGQLDEFIKKMKEKGVELKFETKEFHQGVLKHISGSMSYKDNKSVFSASDFKRLILAMIEDGYRIYFKVNTSDEREVI